MNRRVLLSFALGVLGGSILSALVLSANVTKHSPASPSPGAVQPRELAPHESLPAVSAPVRVSGSAPAAAPASADTPAFRALFLPEADPLTEVYSVVSGDTLTAIARKAGSTAGLLQRINGLPDDRLRVGQKIKVPKTPFTVVVDRSQNVLMLKAGEEVLKTYAVSTGAPGQETPLGVFRITDRLINPTWYKAGAVVPPDSAENVLGTRWLGFTIQGYGIHGTTEPDKIGQAVTAGCVRMRNAEAEELYDFLPAGAEVTIVD